MAPEVDNSSLESPYPQIVKQLDPDDARALAMHVDVGMIVQEFKKINYDLQRKIKELGDILDTGTPPQKMAAMDRLDNIREAAVSKRGILQMPSGSASGSDQPLGLPSPRTVEITEKSVKMTMDSTAGLAVIEPDKQPLKEQDNAEEKEPDQDDAFYADTRGDKDVFRGPTVAIESDPE